MFSEGAKYFNCTSKFDRTGKCVIDDVCVQRSTDDPTRFVALFADDFYDQMISQWTFRRSKLTTFIDSVNNFIGSIVARHFLNQSYQQLLQQL
jgi:hypothetical protein